MNRRNLQVGALLFVCLAVATRVWAHGNENRKAEAMVGNAKVTIEYAAPDLKGRDISKMIQPGKLWRLGADKPTTLESDADLDFGGTRVPKGKHILLARYDAPGKWTLVVSSKTVNQFQPDAKLAEAPMRVEDKKDSTEAMSIELTGDSGQGTITVDWGTQRLVATFAPAK